MVDVKKQKNNYLFEINDAELRLYQIFFLHLHRNYARIAPEGMKTKQEYIDILRSHAGELTSEYGITYMRLFGSVAKDNHHNGSDVDLFVIMPAKAYLYCAAADYLESILGENVDLIRKHSNMRPFFLNQINKYGIDIFKKESSMT